MSRHVVLYRHVDMSAQELKAAARHFVVTDSRMTLRKDDLVVGRYSVLPFYQEQERDLKLVGAQLINSYAQHCYVADFGQWYGDLYETEDPLTPRTWFGSEAMMAANYGGPFVVKGATNSKRQQWGTHMFAHNKQEALQVMFRLQQDALIGQQPIVFRQYIPLKKLCHSISGMPISKEFRFFIAYGRVLCGAFYWSSYIDDIGYTPDVSEVPQHFLGEVVARIGRSVNFVVVDVAQSESGEWLVVELNDGQMSGLSLNDPEVLYREVAKVLRKEADAGWGA